MWLCVTVNGRECSYAAVRGSVSMSVVCPHGCFGVTECPRAYLRSPAQHEARGDSCALTKATNSPRRVAALGISSSGI